MVGYHVGELEKHFPATVHANMVDCGTTNIHHEALTEELRFFIHANLILHPLGIINVAVKPRFPLTR